MKRCVILSIFSIAMLALLCGCTDYGKVTDAHKDGNSNAKDLLMYGLTRECADKIPSYLIDRALNGDEDAKLIILFQIQALTGKEMKRSCRVMPNGYVPMPNRITR